LIKCQRIVSALIKILQFAINLALGLLDLSGDLAVFIWAELPGLVVLFNVSSSGGIISTHHVLTSFGSAWVLRNFAAASMLECRARI
jgi:hypothetical protein